MREWVKRWLGIDTTQQETFKASNAVAVAALNAHIETLKAQIAYQQQMIETLSDQKFFKPEIIHKDVPVETEIAIPVEDYNYGVTPEAPPENSEPDESELAGMLSEMTTQYAEYKAGKR